MRPLFKAFPQLQAVVPSCELARLPTPVTRLDLDGRPLLVKRDDLSHPRYGGNKVRKLDLILADARAKGIRRVVTFGGLGTHHGLATALFCAELGFDCELLLFDQPVTAAVQDNLRLLAGSGARLRPCGSLARTLATFYLDPRYWSGRSLRLFAGGSTPLGVLAFVDAALELGEQLERKELPRPSAIYCPVGSLSTFVGLTLGMSLVRPHIPVIGVRVANARFGPFAACNEAAAQTLMRATVRWLERRGSRWPQPLPVARFDHNWIGNGYGHPTPAGTQAAAAFEAAGGPPLDPTYTAKTVAAVRATLAGPQAGTPLYWHTLNSAELAVDPATARRLPTRLRALLDRPPIA